jgi:glycyl-tRNA synthetase beta chain
MAANKRADFLVEIGTEELPPRALRTLMRAFASTLAGLLEEHRLVHGPIGEFATPRRIAALVPGLALAQESRQVDARGPPVSIAFNDAGDAKPPAVAFAKKCGVDVQDLQRMKTDKGEWLSYQSVEEGVAAAELLPAIIEQTLKALPVPRRMRWGASELEFVRPVHWVVMLHGKNVVPGDIMGRTAGDETRGHRFLAPGNIKITSPGKYAALLESKGFVLADFDSRQQKIVSDVTKAAGDAGGTVVAADSLFEEVAALTEWPVAMTGRFDDAFLALPREVIVATLTGHQRYFPIADASGELISAFVLVANLDSKDPEKVRSGNERVIRPRLADADFFWTTDRNTPLADRISDLDSVVYQKGLGSLLEKSTRVAKLCGELSEELGIDGQAALRAATLAKCDLLTGMVGEFPELQGIMGSYYALADGESAEVATAVREQYLPRFAGDALPGSSAGQVLALADKLDTLAGVFALGKKPTGNKDPFGLRRAALGVVRILIEGRLEVGLMNAVSAAVNQQPVDGIDQGAVANSLYGFIGNRLRSFYLEQPDVSAEIFASVEKVDGRSNVPLADFDRRISAVAKFARMTESASLASANKRISNILQQSAVPDGSGIEESLLLEGAERDLYDALLAALAAVEPLQNSRDYAAVLARLADLKDPVDRFFDEVLVMVDDEALKQNRLALLSRLREPFHSVADISRLSVAKSDGS